jgi:hypothetical protein
MDDGGKYCRCKLSFSDHISFLWASQRDIFGGGQAVWVMTICPRLRNFLRENLRGIPVTVIFASYG